MARQVRPFQLDAVLNYRKRLEDIARQRLFEAQRVKETISQKLQQQQRSFTRLAEESARDQAAGITISELIRYDERINYLGDQIKAINKTLAEKEAIVRSEQENLAKRSKERQVMERLKEQQNRAWIDHLEKKEAAMLDEIAVLRHNMDRN